MSGTKLDWVKVDAVVRELYRDHGPAGCKQAYPFASEWSFRKSARRQGIQISEEYLHAIYAAANEKSRTAQKGRTRARKTSEEKRNARLAEVERLRAPIKAKIAECIALGVNPYGSYSGTLRDRV